MSSQGYTLVIVIDVPNAHTLDEAIKTAGFAEFKKNGFASISKLTGSRYDIRDNALPYPAGSAGTYGAQT